MSKLSIGTKNNQTAFVPGKKIEGAAGWKLDEPPESVEVRLFWHTDGKGTPDVTLVDTVTFEHPLAEEARPFTFVAPAAPVSFSGKLISLTWSLELVVTPGRDCARLDLVISPNGQEIVLGSVAS